MKRKIISLLLCLVMALSLIPTVAFAATDDLTTNGAYSSNGWSAGGTGTINTDGLTLSKTATYLSENTYRIDLSVVTTQEVTTQDSPAAVALVIDTSGSMAWCSDYHKHSDDCYKNSERCGPLTDKYDHWVWIGLVPFHKADTSCRLMDGKDGFGLYPASCGTTQHTHDTATGGDWCGNSTLNEDTDSRIANAKAAATAFISSFKSTSAARYVAVIDFNSSVTSTAWYNVSDENERKQALDAINNLGANGGTDMAAGLSSANTLISATPIGVEASNRHVILLSDGAPTYANRSGNGSSGSAEINKTTSDTAATLQNAIAPGKLYTICFSAEDEICYSTFESNGPTVGEFLRKSIASSPNDAYKAETATELNKIFTDLSSTITSGLDGKGWTVTDPMADNISVVDGSTSSEFVLTDANSKTYTWTLSNPKQTSNGNTTTYTYATRYTVTIAPNGTDLNENDFYPTNKVTTLHYTDAKGNLQTADFPVPGVKVKLPDPTPTTGNLTINKVFEGLPENTCPESVMFTVTGPNNYNQTVTMTANDQWTKTLTDLTPGDYTVTETSADVTGYTYTTNNNTGTSSNDGKTATVTVNANADSAATVNFINTYEEESTPPAEDVPVNIPVTKTVSAKVGSTLPKNLPSFTFKAYLGEKEVGILTLALNEKTKVSGAQNQYRGTLTANIPAAAFANNNNMVTLTIKEDKGIDTKWKYDTREYTVTVRMVIERAVAEDPLVIMLGNDVVDSVSFENIYSYKYTPAPRPTTPAKPVTSVKTGDMGVALYAGLAILSMTGSAGVILRRRKNDK